MAGAIPCVTSSEFKFYSEPPRGEDDQRRKRIRAEYAKKPSEFGLYVYQSPVDGSRNPTRIPIENIAEIGRTVDLKFYTATTRAGDEYSRIALDMCRRSSVGTSNCARVYYIGLMCENGEERIVHLYNENAPSPGGRRAESMSKLTQIDVATLVARSEAIMRAHQAADEYYAARNQQAAVRRAQKRMDEQRASDNVMRNAPINTVMFCTSAVLLAPGMVTSSIPYTCDLTGSYSVTLRKAIELGWDVVSETRSPQRTIVGGTSLEISVQLRKAR